MKHLSLSTFLCFVILAIATAWPASAQTATPTSEQQIKLSFAPVVKATAPAVVNIYTKRIIERQARQHPFFDDPFFERFFGRQAPLGQGRMRERVQNSLGSGVIVSDDGYIISNAHVVKNADEIVAVTSAGEEMQAKLVFFDESLDLSVLKVSHKEKLPFLYLADKDDLEVGDLALAIGNPFGVGQTVTSGIISAVGRTGVGVNDVGYFIQTDAAINPGNSGGALVDMDGALIGINTAIFSKSGGSLGIGFAIPVEMVHVVLAAVEQGLDRLPKPWVGFSAPKITNDIAESLGLKAAHGLIVDHIHPKGPADKAGLKLGDVILQLNGRKVTDPSAMKFYIATAGKDKAFKLTVWRKGKEKTLSIKPIDPPEEPPRNITTLQGRHPFHNVVVANISPALIHEMGRMAKDKGVVVLQAQRSMFATVKVGDVILAINGQKVSNVKSLQKILAAKPRGWKIELQRGVQVIRLMVSG